jgi:hypothetical protein
MSLLKDLQKSVKSHHVLALLGLIVLAAVFMQYSNRKGGVVNSMRNYGLDVGADTTPQRAAAGQQQYVTDISGPASGPVAPANPAGQNEVFASVSGESNAAGYGLPPSCSRQPVVNPDELLPKDENSQWAQLNPRGNGELNNVNLLQAGYLYGINTVGSSLRNANLQVRSEPPNPQVQVSPWLNTTIEPDLMRTPLELGIGTQ